jgi:hypothetical protein
MGILVFEAELASLSFDDHLSAHGNVRLFRWDGETSPRPDLSKCSMNWEVVPDRTPFEHFERVYGAFPPNPYLLEGSELSRERDVRRSVGVFWFYDEGACCITLATPPGPGFEAFISSCHANDLRLFVQIRVLFSRLEGTPSPTPEAFLEGRRPVFLMEPAKFTAYRRNAIDLNDPPSGSNLVMRNGMMWHRLSEAIL